MNKPRKGKYKFAEDVQARLGRNHRENAGHTLSIADTKVVSDVELLWLSIIREILKVQPGTPEYGRLLKMSELLAETPVDQYIKSMKACDSLLLLSAENRDLRKRCRFLDVANNAEIFNKQAKELLRCTIGLLKNLLTEWYETSSISAFHTLHDVFAFPGRLPLREDTTLKNVALGKWVEAERYIASFDIDYNIASKVSDIISEWFPTEWYPLTFEADQQWFLPHHGSGSTFEGLKELGQKVSLQGLDESLIWFYTEIGFEFDTLMQSPSLKSGNDNIINQLYERSSPTLSYRRSIDLFDKDYLKLHWLQAVPKNAETNRFVSMEPVAKMFAQEGIFSWVAKYVESLPGRKALGKFYKPTSDERNRRLAWRGSLDGSYSTIDLSSASDLIAWILVQYLFRNSCMSKPLDASRTTFCLLDQPVELDGCKVVYKDESTELYAVKVLKHAPMGSANCFWVMSAIIAAIDEFEMREMKRYGGLVNNQAAVYGDDNVVPTDIVEYVIQDLEALGLKVNGDKTFCNDTAYDNCFFRESCGGEYLRGEDVKPVRIPRNYLGLCNRASLPFIRVITDDTVVLGGNEAKQVAQAIDLANRLFDRGYLETRNIILHSLLEAGIVPYFEPTGFIGVKADPQYCTNYGAERRYNPDLQQYEVRVMVSRTCGANLKPVRNKRKVFKLARAWEVGKDQQGPVRLYNNLRRGRALDSIFDYESGQPRYLLRKLPNVIRWEWLPIETDLAEIISAYSSTPVGDFVPSRYERAEHTRVREAMAKADAELKVGMLPSLVALLK